MARSAIHPGEHLAEALAAIGVTPTDLARRIKAPANRITGIIHGQRAVTADTALRLGHYSGMSPQFWMNLQQIYELRLAERQVGAQVRKLPRAKGVPADRAVR